MTEFTLILISIIMVVISAPAILSAFIFGAKYLNSGIKIGIYSIQSTGKYLMFSAN